ncbi:MAG: 3-hydroxyacyl-CoA dehydrogenase family protein, partial [Promethearchaeota archaeon]
IAFNWALDYAVENGIPLEHVDNDLFTPFMPMSPMILLDYIGLDVNYDISKHYESVLHPDFKPGEVMSKKIKMNELGKKTGKGLYEWKGNTLPEVDRTHKAGILSLELVFALQANEGCRLLEEKVIDKYSTVDDTLRNGFNMLGPFSILMDGNEEKWIQLLEDFAKKSRKVYLKPCELMKSGGYKEFQ